jgi:hypothetical protein
MPNFRSWACGRKTFPEIYPHWRPVFVKDTGQILIGKTMDIPFLHDIEQTCMLETLAIEPGDSHARTKNTPNKKQIYFLTPVPPHSNIEDCVRKSNFVFVCWVYSLQHGFETCGSFGGGGKVGCGLPAPGIDEAR